MLMHFRNLIARLSRADASLIAILVCATGVRAVGLSFGQPHPFARPDESHVASIVSALYTGATIHTFNYPLLYMGILTLLVSAWTLLGRVLGYVDGLDGAAALLTDAKVRTAARVLSMASGVASVGMVFAIARRLFDRQIALVSAACLALAFLHVRDSHFGVTDVSAGFMALVAFYVIIRLDETGEPRDLLLAGVCAGLATATKYNVALIALPAVAVILWPARRNVRVRTRASRLAMFGMAMAGGFFVGSPQAVLQYRETFAALAYETQHLSQGHGLDLGRGWSFHLYSTLRYGLSLPLFVTAMAGLLLLPLRQRRKGVILGLFPLAYYVLIGSGRTVFARYMVPVVPFLCMCAGYAIVSITRWALQRTNRTAWESWVLWPVTACLVAPSAWAVVRLDLLLSRTDTRVMAAQWVARHHQQARIAHIGPDGGQVIVPARDGTPLPAFPVEAFATSASAPDLVVVQTSPLQQEGPPRELTDRLTREYVLAAEFTGTANDPRNVYDWQDEFYLPLAGFYGIDRPGPNLKIYERKRTERNRP